MVVVVFFVAVIAIVNLFLHEIHIVVAIYWLPFVNLFLHEIHIP